jgi:predicted MFS family arabinose efflux permease
LKEEGLMAEMAADTTIGHPGRWRILGAFLVALILTQTLWFNFAPLLPMLASRYGVTELTASWTVLVFSLSNILLSSAAGEVIDKQGYRFAILLGLIGMSVFAGLRIFEQNFWVLLAGQAGISASVPLIFICVPRIVADLFPLKDATRISGFCSIGICVGSSSSLWLSPRIILGMGLRPAMILFATIVAAWTICFALLVPRSKAGATALKRVEVKSSYLDLFRHRSLALLYLIGFIGHGIFTCVTTWIGVLWHDHGFSSQAAGIGGSMLIIGGICGCLAVPNLLSQFGSYRLLLWTAFVPCIFLVTPFLWPSSPSMGFLWGGLMGFFYLSMMPTAYSMVARYAPADRLGAASGLYLTISSIGGIVITICFRLLKQATGWHGAIIALEAGFLMMSLLVALIRDRSPMAVTEPALEVAF